MSIENEDTSRKILGLVFEANLGKIKELFVDYNYGDVNFPHPILWEIIHQAGCDPEKTGCDRHKKQNELLKWALQQEKFKKLFHNDNYRDKYGNTAYERLAGNILYMNDEKLINWIRNSNFGPGREYNQLLLQENIKIHKDYFGGPSGKYSLNDKFPKAINIVE